MRRRNSRARAQSAGHVWFAGNPSRLRLVRIGNAFTSHVPVDGEISPQIDSQTVALGTYASVGFAVASHSSTVSHTGQFTQLVIRKP
ncbi:MAG TPA: hypothetical protein VK477_10630 [Acidobacteriota bacterium]|nr:hypothetical protein [Acidobacteriota bacterium]